MGSAPLRTYLVASFIISVALPWLCVLCLYHRRQTAVAKHQFIARHATEDCSADPIGTPSPQLSLSQSPASPDSSPLSHYLERDKHASDDNITGAQLIRRRVAAPEVITEARVIKKSGSQVITNARVIRRSATAPDEQHFWGIPPRRADAPPLPPDLPTPPPVPTVEEETPTSADTVAATPSDTVAPQRTLVSSRSKEVLARARARASVQAEKSDDPREPEPTGDADSPSIPGVAETRYTSPSALPVQQQWLAAAMGVVAAQQDAAGQPVEVQLDWLSDAISQIAPDLEQDDADFPAPLESPSTSRRPSGVSLSVTMPSSSSPRPASGRLAIRATSPRRSPRAKSTSAVDFV